MDTARPKLRRAHSHAHGALASMVVAFTATTTPTTTTTSSSPINRRFTLTPASPENPIIAPMPSPERSLRLLRTHSSSNVSRRRIMAVPHSPSHRPQPIVRSNSTSGGSARLSGKHSFKAHPNSSRYSNRSYVDGNSTRGRRDIEVEELSEPSCADHNRQVSMAPPAAPAPEIPIEVKREPTPDQGSPSKALKTWAVASTGLKPHSRLSHTYRLACWLGVLALHGVCTVLFVCLAVIHAEFPRTRLAQLLQYYSPDLEALDLRSVEISILSSALGFIHLAIVIRMLRHSYLHRQLMYYGPTASFSQLRPDQIMPFSASFRALTVRATSSPQGPVRQSPKFSHVLVNLTRTLWSVFQELLWARRELVILNYTKESEWMYRGTVLAQSIVHIYGVNLMSRSVPTSWMDQVYVGCIVTNAWLPFALSILRNQQIVLWHTHRILSLVSSIVLDAVAVLVIPIAMIRWYLKEYDPTSTTFPPTRWFCDRWVTQMFFDVSFLLTMGPIAFALRLLVCLHLLSSLNALKSLLESVTSTRTEISSLDRSMTASTIKGAQQQPPPPLLIQRKPGSRRIWFSEFLLILAGLVTTIAYVRAQHRAYPVSCPLMLRPWFVTSPYCPLLEVNCMRLAVNGTAEDLAAALDGVDAKSVRNVVIISCPHVEMPPKIQLLSNLVALKLRNATVDGWSTDAALSATYHKNARVFSAVNVHFTSGILPAGLITPSLPTRLREVWLCNTTIRALPVDLDLRWPDVTTLVLELSALTEVPEAIVRMSALTSLSLSGNAITTVPPSLLARPRPLERLWLNSNPITLLPGDVDVTPTLTRLAIDATDVSSLPRWAASGGSLVVYAGQTPFCRDVDAATLADVTALGVSCEPFSSDSMTMYPLLMIDDL